MPVPKTVLIVDDDPQILRLVEKMLGARRVNVLMAPRPSAALRICEQQPLDLLIADVALPEMDGDKLAERVLKLQPGAAVLLISGYYKDLPSSARLPQVRFLKKPFFPSQLIAQLRELLPET
jgi:two-component system cell cycle sensor histidine kinase/response regulator CckA